MSLSAAASPFVLLAPLVACLALVRLSGTAAGRRATIPPLPHHMERPVDTPADLKYTREHEWVRVDDGGIATIGITDFAQDQLGDIVYLGLPEIGATLTQFERAGEIESVKSVSDLYSPLSGEVVERNDLAIDTPELVNQSPYGEGWLWQVRMNDPTELENLLSAADYSDLTRDAGH